LIYFSTLKAVEYATLHSVLDEAKAIYNGSVVNVYSFSLSSLYDAFNTLYPEKYCYDRFRHYIKEDDLMGVVIDLRGGSKEKYGDLHKKWLMDVMSSGKAYSILYMWEKIAECCHEYGLSALSLSWVKTNYYKPLPYVYQTRYGSDKATTQLPYAGIKRALAPG